MSVYENALGMLPPSDEEHRVKYPLTAATAPTTPTPAVIGIQWHRAFDAPEQIRDGKRTIWIVAKDGNLGSVRGGHCVMLPCAGFRDTPGWAQFYDQGSEGACVGFGVARMLTHLNRKRYDAFDIYHRAQKIDEWAGEAYSGTSVRAGLDVVRDEGPRWVYRGTTRAPNLAEGIAVNRWATDMTDLLTVLGWDQSASLVPFLNSWNGRYPQVTYMPVDVLNDLLFVRGGDAAVVTDR